MSVRQTQRNVSIHPGADADQLGARVVELEAQLALAREELDRFRARLEIANDMVIEVDRTGTITYVNPTSKELVGREPHEVIGRHFREFLHEDDRDLVLSRFDRRIRGEEVADRYAARFQHLDGTSKWYELNISPVRRDGEIVGSQVVARDDTQRRTAEESLRQSEAILRSIMDSSSDYIMLIDLEKKIRFINRTVSDLSMEKVLGVPIYDFVSPDLHPRMRACFERVIETHQPDRYDVTYWNTDQELIQSFEARVGPVIRDGQVVSMIVNASDVTERKQFEEQLRRQKARLAHVTRLSTMGEMVAGIAHEINQPLAAIANFAGACRRTLEREADPDLLQLRQWLDEISEQSQRTGSIIRRLRRFVDKADAEHGAVDLVQVVRDSIALTANEMNRQRVQISFSPPAEEIIVKGDEIQLQQVLVNLIHNACEAMKMAETDEQWISVEIEHDERVANLVVADHGPGVATAIEEKLFDPFFSTKAEGMGMGLAISRTIIDAHGGRLWLEAHASAGARFHFQLDKAGGPGSP